MFNKEQINLIFKQYAENVVIHRGEDKMPHKGFLMFENERIQRCEFGVLEKQSGNYVYCSESEDLFDGDILIYCGKEFLISKPKEIYLKNNVLYKKTQIEKI